MDFLHLDERIMQLIDDENFDAAEAELHQAKLEAFNAADHQSLDHVLSSACHAPPQQAAA